MTAGTGTAPRTFTTPQAPADVTCVRDADGFLWRVRDLGGGLIRWYVDNPETHALYYSPELPVRLSWGLLCDMYGPVAEVPPQ